jgi:hypothetical protein
MSETNFHTHTEPQAEIMVLYILIFMFLNSRREDKCSGLNGSKHYPSSISTIYNKKQQNGNVQDVEEKLYRRLTDLSIIRTTYLNK